METKDKHIEELEMMKEKFDSQESRIQQLKEEEENRKKKFLLVKNKYDQELEQAQQEISRLQNQLQQQVMLWYGYDMQSMNETPSADTSELKQLRQVTDEQEQEL